MVEGGVTVEARLSMPDGHVALVRAMVDAVRLLSSLDHDPQLTRNLINQAIWDVTQYKESPRHKHGGLRWRTRSAHRVATPPWKDLRHEHVVERGWIMRLLRATPGAAGEVLWNLPAALVTREEHPSLVSGVRWDDTWGWERYEQAGLEVIDAETGRAVNLTDMGKRLRRRYTPLVAAAMRVDPTL